MQASANVALPWSPRPASAPVAAPLHGGLPLRVRLTFYVFLATLPLECVPISEDLLPSVTRLAGMVLFLACLTRPHLTLSRCPPALYFFLVYWLTGFCTGFLWNPDLIQLVWAHLFTFVQCLVLAWIGFNLMQVASVRRTALVVVGVVYSALALAATFGALRTGTAETLYAATGRESLSGFDPNFLATCYGVAALVLIDSLHTRRLALRWMRIVALPAVIVLLAQMVKTGSRGALLAWGVGLIAYFGLRMTHKGGRVKLFVAASLALAVVGATIANSEAVRNRWQLTIEEGHTAGRGAIAAAAWEMFKVRPISGWGPISHLMELARRDGWHETEFRDTHNDLFWALTSTGIIGGLPFVVGVALVAAAAWKARKGADRLLPFALVVMLVATSMSITLQRRKVVWFFVAYAMAANAAAVAAPLSARDLRLHQGARLR